MNRIALVFILLACSTACAQHTPPPSKGPAPAAPRSGPFSSTIPCAEQCGNDARCASSCSNVTNQWPTNQWPPGRP